MTRRTRIFIGILLIYTAGIAFLLYRVVSDIDPRYRESAEESLVETSQLVASLVEQDVIAGAINTARLVSGSCDVKLASCVRRLRVQRPIPRLDEPTALSTALLAEAEARSADL